MILEDILMTTFLFISPFLFLFKKVHEQKLIPFITTYTSNDTNIKNFNEHFQYIVEKYSLNYIKELIVIKIAISPPEATFQNADIQAFQKKLFTEAFDSFKLDCQHQNKSEMNCSLVRSIKINNIVFTFSKIRDDINSTKLAFENFNTSINLQNQLIEHIQANPSINYIENAVINDKLNYSIIAFINAKATIEEISFFYDSNIYNLIFHQDLLNRHNFSIVILSKSIHFF